MEPSQNPFDPPVAEFPEEERRPVIVAAILWAVFLSSVLVDLVYVWRTRALFASMYEGLGNYLPGETRFFLNPVCHAVAFLVVPLLSVAAGVAWRLRPKAGLAVLMVAVALGIGWGLAYRRAMKLPIESLEHVFDSDH